MNPNIRQAVPEDAEAIAQVHIRSWQAAYRGQLPDHFLDRLIDELERRAALWRAEISTPHSPKHEIWVAGIESPVEGFAGIGPARQANAGFGEVYAIYVHPERWGQRLGQMLFAHASTRLAAAGYSAAILWVLESNLRARRFYEVAGWAINGETKLETLPGGIDLQEVRYWKSFHRDNN
jgi:GNAT superfamily N-acetyltransferase